MATDDERRRVAAALRAESGPSLMKLMRVLRVGGKDIFSRLADLIDQDCEDGRYEGVHTARPVDRGARGWTSFNERLPEPGAPVLCKGKNGAYYVGKPVTFGGERTAKVWVPHGNEYRSPAAWRPIEPPSCDREALLELSDKIVKDTEEDMDSRAGLVPAYIAGQCLRDVAKCIREACGEVAE